MTDVNEEGNPLEDNPFSSLWSAVVEPGKQFRVDRPNNTYLRITSACLGELPAHPSLEAVTLKADIKTLKLDEEAVDAPEISSSIVLAALKAGECEIARMNHIFSPLNTSIVLLASGPYPINVVGAIEDMYEEDEEEEEEEEKNEEDEKFDEVEFNKKMVEFARKVTRKDDSKAN